jgi:hypothetical protein
MYDDLEEMLAKLLEAARKLPQGEVRHETLIEIGRFRARIDALSKRSRHIRSIEGSGPEPEATRSPSPPGRQQEK